MTYPTPREKAEKLYRELWADNGTHSTEFIIAKIADAIQEEREFILTELYTVDSSKILSSSVYYSVSVLCDEKLDRSGALLGRIRERSYALKTIRK